MIKVIKTVHDNCDIDFQVGRNHTYGDGTIVECDCGKRYILASDWVSDWKLCENK